MVMLGSVVSMDIVWNFADVSMGLMAITNLVAILLLSNIAFKAFKDYNNQKKQGLDPVFMASSIPEIADDLEFWK